MRKEGGRRHPVKVLLSDQEYLEIGARAAAAGVSRQKLMVEAVLRSDGMTHAERRALYRELLGARNLIAALGNNINQLARVANATGQVPAEVRAAAEAAERAIERLDQQAAALEVRGR